MPYAGREGGGAEGGAGYNSRTMSRPLATIQLPQRLNDHNSDTDINLDTAIDISRNLNTDHGRDSAQISTPLTLVMPIARTLTLTTALALT